MKIRNTLVAVVVAAAGVCASAHASVTFGDFEDGSFNNFTQLGNSGPQPFTPPPANHDPTQVWAEVITPTSGPMTSKVLHVNAPGFNGGQPGAVVAYDFVGNNKLTDFMNNDILSFDWVAPNWTGTPGAYSQLYNIILNAPGLGFKNVDGYSTGNPTTNATGTATIHFTMNYDQWKSQISANPSYLQFAIQTNDGGGAPSDYYFDNFQLSPAAATPEPASLGLLGAGALGLLCRRSRHRA